MCVLFSYIVPLDWTTPVFYSRLTTRPLVNPFRIDSFLFLLFLNHLLLVSHNVCSSLVVHDSGTPPFLVSSRSLTFFRSYQLYVSDLFSYRPIPVFLRLQFLYYVQWVFCGTFKVKDPNPNSFFLSNPVYQSEIILFVVTGVNSSSFLKDSYHKLVISYRSNHFPLFLCVRLLFGLIIGPTLVLTLTSVSKVESPRRLETGSPNTHLHLPFFLCTSTLCK